MSPWFFNNPPAASFGPFCTNSATVASANVKAGIASEILLNP
jgi:hypothetical protein